MKTTLLISSVLLAISGVLSNPVPSVKREADAVAPTVTQILQFALTLEHLENAFYKNGLSSYDNHAFEQAGMPSWERGRLAQIGQHESSHVKFLTDALGDGAGAPQPCEYSFPMSDVKSFVQISGILENVGVSAYSGAAQYLGSNPSALTAAAVILSTEARHAAWITAITQSMAPWSGAYDVPLTGNQIITLASGFITSCPSSNPQLPFTPFPKLTINGKYTAGQKVSLSFDASKANGQPLFLALQTGLNTVFTPISGSKAATIPQGLQGIVYASVSTNGQALTDGSTIAGPAVLDFPFTSSASNA